MQISAAVFAIAILQSCNVMAQSAAQDLVGKLSQCDSAFFEELRARAPELDPHFKVQIRGNVGTIQVPDVTHPTQSRVIFSRPLALAGLEIVGYYDELIPIPGGVAVSWGFLIGSTVETTTNAFRQFLWEADRLRSGEGMFVRSEVWRHASPNLGWVKEATEPGLPKPNTVERVFMIEPYFEEDKFIRAGCSLQGAVNRNMMQLMRPDFILKKVDA